MKCIVEGCEASPAKGDHFFRVTPIPGGPWVCKAHFDTVEMDPKMKAIYAHYASFFKQENKQ